jgi:hypothetical protein
MSVRGSFKAPGAIRLLMVSALMLFIAGAGCTDARAGDPSADSRGSRDTTDGQGMDDAGDETATACSEDERTEAHAYTWTLPDDYASPGGEGAEDFLFPEGTIGFHVNGSNGNMVDASWHFWIDDGQETVWEYGPTVPVTASVGSDTNVPSATIWDVGPGEYAFHWEIEGQIDHFEIVVTAILCQT